MHTCIPPITINGFAWNKIKKKKIIKEKKIKKERDTSRKKVEFSFKIQELFLALIEQEPVG